ncbi:MAG: dihydroneopterin aldolase [Gammaproteobacteria bacterium]|nr:dihydroneopterin aldolase [Gammaproteobacteria bacterium]
MDIVFLHGLRMDTVIGIWDWERRLKQTLIVDLDLGTDHAHAAASDSIDDTIDYKAVTKRLLKLGDEHAFLLVEALAEAIAQILLGEFNVQWVRVKLNKRGAVRQVRDVGVIIERRKAGGAAA